MRTNIEIDDELVAELMKLTGRKTKRQVVDDALRDQLHRRRAGKQSSSWRARWTGTVIRKSWAPRRKVDVIIATWCIESGLPLLHNDRDFNVMERELGLLSALSAD